MGSGYFNPVLLIEEVRRRPGLYRAEQPADRLERLQLWKEVGAALFSDWESFGKGAMYMTVLQIQKKWRSLRDAYNRELRARRSGVRTQRRVYIYFKKMSFLGGFDGQLSDDDEDTAAAAEDSPAISGKARTVSRARKRKRAGDTSSDSEPPTDEVEMPLFHNVDLNESLESDTDRLFLLSFLPELRRLPLNVKMWTRAQIANIMQEAVYCHINDVQPGQGQGQVPAGGAARLEVKQRRDSSD